MSHITESQRYTIARLYSKGAAQTYIAKIINKDKSVVCREIRRNKDKRSGIYNSDLAQRKYEKRIKEKPKKKRFDQATEKRVKGLIRNELSPEQVVGYCKKNNIFCVSHERIYQYIWRDKKLGGTLYKHLRRQGRKYRKRGNKKDNRGMIKNRKGIEERPGIVDKKQRFGDLEIDTIIGKNHKGAIVTVNDRVSGYLWMGKVNKRTARNISRVTYGLLKEFKGVIKTITSDNGKEFAMHEKIAELLNINFYFAKPHHPWQRGANENLNGLIRQYIPKKTDFDTISHAFVKHVQNKINDRPRKRFNYENSTFMKNKLLTNKKVAFVT